MLQVGGLSDLAVDPKRVCMLAHSSIAEPLTGARQTPPISFGAS